MREPRITNDPFADADARDRWQQEQAEKSPKICCCKCKHRLEDGEEYYFIKTQLDEIIICEYCIGDYVKVKI